MEDQTLLMVSSTEAIRALDDSFYICNLVAEIMLEMGEVRSEARYSRRVVRLA